MDVEKSDLRWHYYWIGACISEFQAGFISNKCKFCSIGEVASSSSLWQNFLQIFWFSIYTELGWEREIAVKMIVIAFNGWDRTTMNAFMLDSLAEKSAWDWKPTQTVKRGRTLALMEGSIINGLHRVPAQSRTRNWILE